ncbi:unnamed protein product, partial [Ectocarpus sp. 12 AP-2014]
PIVTSPPSVSQDEVGELKRRVKKLEDAVAALQAVSQQHGINGKPHDPISSPCRDCWLLSGLPAVRPRC